MSTTTAFESVRHHIRVMASVWLRRMPDRSDAIADADGHAWAIWQAALGCGKHPAEFHSVVAQYACRAVRQQRSLSNTVGRKRPLPCCCLRAAEAGRMRRDAAELVDAATSRGASVPDVAAMRVDFPEWLKTLPERTRQLAMDLAAGMRAKDAAEVMGVSEGRLSQMRRELADSWAVFTS